MMWRTVLVVAMKHHTVCICVFMMSHWFCVALGDVSSPKHCPNMDMWSKEGPAAVYTAGMC